MLVFRLYIVCYFLSWIQEFIIHTPDFEAAKFWVGNMGKHATHALVYAQLYTPDGQCHGLHSFIVQVKYKYCLSFFFCFPFGRSGFSLITFCYAVIYVWQNNSLINAFSIYCSCNEDSGFQCSLILWWWWCSQFYTHSFLQKTLKNTNELQKSLEIIALFMQLELACAIWNPESLGEA